MKGQREKNIKAVIKLEERVAGCRRCSPVMKCTGRPSVGRGDMQPDLMIVFEAANDLTRNMQWIAALHNSMKQAFGVGQIYHTFLVRCPVRVCPTSQGNDCFLTSKLMDRHDICLLTGQPCNGVALKPTNESILNCLTFLLEEIGVLHPARLILMGARVTEFVLKAFGLQDPTFDKPVYKLGESLFIPSSAEYELSAPELEALAAASHLVSDR